VQENQVGLTMNGTRQLRLVCANNDNLLGKGKVGPVFNQLSTTP
jgi:hypothetical protein